MTREEREFRDSLIYHLGKQGYSTYSKILSLFDLRLTANPKVVGYMIPEKAEMCLNRYLDIDEASLVARHEILHEYLDHLLRIKKHVGEAEYEASWDQAKQERSNIAGDYEISNRGYTEADKKLIKDMKLHYPPITELANLPEPIKKLLGVNPTGNIEIDVPGLVTDIDHPEWANKSLEQMYDLLETEQNELEQNLMNQNQNTGKDGEGEAQGRNPSTSPQIGDKGDTSIEELEDEIRQAQEAQEAQKSQGSEEDGEDKGSKGSANKDDQGDEKDSSDSDSTSNNSDKSDSKDKSKDGSKSNQGQAPDAQDVINDAKELIDDIKDLEKKKDSMKGFSKPGNRISEEELAKRKEAIEKAFGELRDQALQQSGESDLEREVKQKDRKYRSGIEAAKQAKDLAKYNRNPTNIFLRDINNFIRKQTADNDEDTWTRVDRRYQTRGYIHPGHGPVENKHIPVLNVYFDCSGSWTGRPEKVAAGERAIAELRKYEKQGKLKIKLYYFATRVFSDRESAERDGGNDGRAIIQHVIDTKPDNVVILTDGDSNYTGGLSYQVPGCVWYVFEDNESPDLVAALTGRLGTKKYNIDYMDDRK